MATETYRRICSECKGEGTTRESAPSIGGIGGTVEYDRACRSCNGTGEGDLVTVTIDCDTCSDAGIIITADGSIDTCPDCEGYDG